MTKATKKTFKKDLTTTPELNYNRDNKAKKGDRPMTNYTISQLKQIARERGIEVKGDKRKRITWLAAVGEAIEFDRVEKECIARVKRYLFAAIQYLKPDGKYKKVNQGIKNLYHSSQLSTVDRHHMGKLLSRSGYGHKIATEFLVTAWTYLNNIPELKDTHRELEALFTQIQRMS